MFPQMAFSKRYKVTRVKLVWLWLRCVFSNEPSNYLLEKMSRWLQLFVFSPLCVWKMEIHPQMAYLGGCTVSMIAFVRFFSVCFHMSPQMASSRGCIVTLIAFIWLVSTVGFHMFPQIGWIMACIDTLVISICFCFFFHCEFSNVSTKRLHKRMYSYIGCICCAFLHCAFSNVSSTRLPEMMHSHTGCIC